ncbi:MAG: hypothetical protein VB130_10780, partial [Clostridium sp.]|nr:hypothetical protein [Clostridium sp.]
MFNKSNQNIINKTSKELEDEIEKFTLRKSLRENINLFRTRIFNDEDSIVFRIFQNKKSNIEFCIIFFDGMVESLIVNEGIIHPIMYGYLDNKVDNNDLPNYLMNKIIDSKDVRLTSDMSK